MKKLVIEYILFVNTFQLGGTVAKRQLVHAKDVKVMEFLNQQWIRIVSKTSHEMLVPLSNVVQVSLGEYIGD